VSEAEIRAAVAGANVPVLLMVLFQMTGDERWLSPPFLPTRGQGLDDHDSGGLDEALQAEVREAAVGAILDLEAGRTPAITIPGPDLAARMMSVLMGEAVEPRYGPMLASELARRVAPDDAITQVESVAPPPGFRVVILGAGVSGIIAARELDAMGVDFVVLERQPAPGGNWWQNTYPGAGVDTPSHLYSFSFAFNDWGRHFELRDNLQEYFERVMATTAGDAARVRYGTTVRRATYDEVARRWTLDVTGSGGEEETLTADVVLSAVGVLNRPQLPDIPGVEDFEGISFHSSNWPADLDLTGKRVALVGAGASAMQVSCAIAPTVGELVIFQRSPQWIAPFGKFQKPIDDDLRVLLRSIPLYMGWYWLRLFWQFGDRVIEALRVDPEWDHPERSVNRRNDGHRQFFTGYLEGQLAGRPDLIAKSLPDYPPFGKRILLDNGWYKMLRRDNVTLVAESVARLGAHSIASASGDEHEVDVVIWATGFDVARFVGSFDVVGVGGETLRDFWEDDNPRAYLGVSVPGFPNFFMLGGPNSFPGSGSFMYFMEVQMRYIRRLLTEQFRRRSGPMAVDREVHDSYNETVDALHERMVWTHPGMSTWYRNRHGRVVFAMPFLNVEYWEATRRVDVDEYVVY
jgi:4-hydroxyacetophenone monooxygenase